MSSDTKWIVGTVVGSMIASTLAILAVVVALFADVRADLRDVRVEIRALDERLRAVEVAFGKVGGRLETLERAVIPPAAPAG